MLAIELQTVSRPSAFGPRAHFIVLLLSLSLFFFRRGGWVWGKGGTYLYFSFSGMKYCMTKSTAIVAIDMNDTKVVHCKWRRRAQQICQLPLSQDYRLVNKPMRDPMQAGMCHVCTRAFSGERVCTWTKKFMRKNS